MDRRQREDIMVDFEQKGLEYEQLVTGPTGQFFHADIQREIERQRWEDETKRAIDEDYAEREKRMEKRRILEQLNEETRLGRDKHKQLELKRKIAKITRQEQIKQKIQSRKDKVVAAASSTPDSGGAEEEEEEEEDIKEAKKLKLKKPKLNESPN